MPILLGSVTSSFSGFRANLVNGFAGFAHPSLMCWAVSKVSPFEVEVAPGMNSQTVGCMLLALTVPAMNVPCSRVLCDCFFHI